MAKAYLDRLTGQHEEIRARVEALQELSVTEERDLTEDELRSVTEDSAKAKVLEERILEAHDIETRAASVSALAPIPPRVRAAGNAVVTERDPGHYRSVSEGGQNSFFGDMYRAQFNRDVAAQTRLDEHSRALTVGASSGSNHQGGSGIVPPKWLTDLYLPLSRQNRVVANLVTHLDLGNDPRPLVLPKQTAGTDAVVAAQTEGTAVSGTDAFNTSTETLTPNAVAGQQTVSRQLIDSSTPGVDQLIAADLLSVYDAQIESLVVNALVAAAGAAVTTFAAETNFQGVTSAAGSAAYNSVIDMETAVWKARFLPATAVIASPTRYGYFRKLVDLQGRPILGAYGPMNAIGTDGTSATPNGLVGEVAGLPFYVTSALSVAALSAETYLAARSSDTILAESDLMQFRFEEVQGPQNIVLGLWRYAGVIVRQSGHGVAATVVTSS
jgi:HK97 family phage major capsid protein